MMKEEFKKLMESNESFKKIKTVAEECGYDVEFAYVSHKCPKVSIISKTRNEFYDFYPRFYLTILMNFENKSYDYEWTISTTSYGDLDGEKLEQYFNWLKNAKTLYDELVKIDLYSLYEVTEEIEN